MAITEHSTNKDAILLVLTAIPLLVTIVVLFTTTNSIVFLLALISVSSLVLLAYMGYHYVIQNRRHLHYLRDAQRKFEEVLDHSNDMTYQIDLQTGEYLYMSKSIVKALGYSFEEMYNSGPSFFLSKVHPDDLKYLKVPVYGEVTEDELKDFQSEIEFRIKKKSGEYIWAYLRRSLVFDKYGQPISVVGNGYDITDRVKVRQELDKSLQEKEILLSEIHHRVKNNLAVISSLLILQKDSSDHPLVENALQQSSNRVQSIAEIHELLYQNDTFTHIDMDQYLNKLLKRIIRNFSTDTEITYTVDCKNVSLILNQAVPFGLLINELVTNSCKHAFSDMSHGNILIQMVYDDDALNVTYKDNGVGMASDIFLNHSTAESLGMQLIHALLSQVASDFKFVDTDSGFQLVFQIETES